MGLGLSDVGRGGRVGRAAREGVQIARWRKCNRVVLGGGGGY